MVMVVVSEKVGRGAGVREKVDGWMSKAWWCPTRCIEVEINPEIRFYASIPSSLTPGVNKFESSTHLAPNPARDESMTQSIPESWAIILILRAIACVAFRCVACDALLAKINYVIQMSITFPVERLIRTEMYDWQPRVVPQFFRVRM